MNTLLVYAQLPEEVSFYVIPNEEITPRQRKFLEMAQNKLANSDDMNEGMRFLCDALASSEQYSNEVTAEADKCVWSEFKVDMGVSIVSPVDHTYFSGFIL